MNKAILLIVLGLALFLIQAQMAGGWTVQDPSECAAAAQFAVTTMNSRSNAGYSLNSITQCSTQVVAGIKYKMILSLNSNSGATTQEVTVWEHPSMSGNPPYFEML